MIRPLAASFAALLACSACSSWIFDPEGDCEVNYRLKIRYDKNLKWADAFANEVKSLRLAAFQNGVLVREIRLNDNRLAEPGFEIDLADPNGLALTPGSYHLVAWCGTENPDVASPSFVVPRVVEGSSPVESLTCRLERQADETYPAYSRKRLEFMFHGALDVVLPEDNNGGDYSYNMSLTKDTNHVRIILQQLSGEDIDARDFNFRIEDANGHYAHDNTLIETDGNIAYLPYSKVSGVAGVGKEDLSRSRVIIQVSGAIADLSIGRMMADHHKDMMLTITNRYDEEVARVPIIQYALLSKEYYEEAYGHRMDDQEFLDREDEYVLTFFLDQNRRWIKTSILIHSWRIVLGDYELGS